jgi:transcription initiation factor TFIIIB Brf1 subunit/transcription initiation factor TFIIB
LQRVVDAKEPCPKCGSKLELHIKNKDITEIWCASCHEFIGLEVKS